MYTQGIYSGPNETLSAATVRKFDYCFEKLGLKPGDRILEIGPGWGAWFELCLAARGQVHRPHHLQGIRTPISSAARPSWAMDWSIIDCDFLAYETDAKNTTPS